MKILILILLNALFLFSVDLLKNVHTLKMNFKQSITYDSGKKTTYSGIIHIKKPHFIKWEYIYPMKRNIYIKKQKVTLDEPELEQVSYLKIEKKLELFKIFKQARKISKHNYIAKAQGKEYKINYQTRLINKITFKDELENDVRMVFTKHRKNITYKNGFFTFSPPSHYDILK